MSHKLVKCMKCGKPCLGRMCRKCYSSKRRGQLSRLPSLKPKNKMKDTERRPNKRYKMKENKKHPYRRSKQLFVKANIFNREEKEVKTNGSKEKSSKKGIKETTNKVAVASEQNLERNEKEKFRSKIL